MVGVTPGSSQASTSRAGKLACAHALRRRGDYRVTPTTVNHANIAVARFGATDHEAQSRRDESLRPTSCFALLSAHSESACDDPSVSRDTRRHVNKVSSPGSAAAIGDSRRHMTRPSNSRQRRHQTQQA
jgi:hypothetical protein